MQMNQGKKVSSFILCMVLIVVMAAKTVEQLPEMREHRPVQRYSGKAANWERAAKNLPLP